MKKQLIKQVSQLEKMSGLREIAIFVFNKEYSVDTRYTFEIIDNKEIFYDRGIEISRDELNSRAEAVQIIDVQFV